MSDLLSLRDRVAIVTGGGTGIGRACALSLAQQGADVVLAGRRPAPLQSTAQDIEALGRRALAHVCDLSDHAQCQRLVDKTLRSFGKLDILINCAGGAPLKDIDAWSDEDWRIAIALNLEAVWNLSRLAATTMLAQGKGAIVNISSGASLKAMPKSPIYAAAKAGVNSLTASLAAAWTPKGVRVNCIAVGAVRAPTLTDEMQRLGIDPELAGKGNALGRLGEPAEIAAELLFRTDALHEWRADRLARGYRARRPMFPGASRSRSEFSMPMTVLN
jgi:NAD(P)-dependent dehydrogenase (short-subunit alcohol dehydrogenase family)